MNTAGAGRNPLIPLPPSIVKQGEYTGPDFRSRSVGSVNSSATTIPDRNQCIPDLLSDVDRHVSEFNEDQGLYSEIKKSFASKLKIIITNHGREPAVRFFSQWPENKKGVTWFHLLTNCLFNNRKASMCTSMITELALQKDSAEAPIAAYLAVLKKLQAEGGLHSPAGFKKFMDWLVYWNLSEVQPGIDLLKNIPDDIRKMRPDLPIIQGSEAKIKIELQEGWGAFERPLHYYLAHTQWIQHYMICAFIEYAPLDFIQPVIESWLEEDGTAAIRDKLFSQEQHPLSVDFFEPRPWNIMLAALDRLLPRLESQFSQAISKLDGSDKSVEQMDDNVIDGLKLSRQSFVFGRTIAFLDPKNTGHFYLKFQSRNESNKVFFQEAQRLQYFYGKKDKYNIADSALRVVSVLKIDSLKDILKNCGLSATDTAQLFLRCTEDSYLDTLCKALRIDSDHMDIKKARDYAKKTHWCNLFADDTPLSEANRRALIDYLNRNDTSCHMMLLRAPADYNYEQYIYDLENHDSVVEGLISYVEEYGAMWSEGVLGPDSCSVFHDKDHDRDYYFLSPYFHKANIGRLDQWAGTSTDFPNVGSAGCRDRGDTRAVSELDTEKLFSLYGRGESHDKLLARGSLEALAKAAWGSILLYGRSLKETFNSNDPVKVARVKDDVSAILGALFSKAFHIPLGKCLEYMNSQDLLAQTAREISYWMSTDYVADLRNGRIPATVYPDYKGIRDGHVLSSYQANFLSADGFKGDYPSVHLGAFNGRNPLMALDAMVVKMLTHGCLNIIKKQK